MFVVMFFILSKILDFIINPFTWVFILFVWGLLLLRKNSLRGRKILFITILVLYFFSNRAISYLAMNAWECTGYSSEQINKPYEVGILMGGCMRYYDEITERPVFSQSVDRLLQTIDLYKKGKIKKVLLTGGSGHVLSQDHKESDFVREVLVEAGIPDSVIIVENMSRNTYENAIYTANLIRERQVKGPILLITSAFHMRRSMACFGKAGLNVDPFPVDGKAQRPEITPDWYLIPDAFSFSLWNQLIHEWVGVIAYWFAGYI